MKNSLSKYLRDAWRESSVSSISPSKRTDICQIDITLLPLPNRGRSSPFLAIKSQKRAGRDIRWQHEEDTCWEREGWWVAWEVGWNWKWTRIKQEDASGWHYMQGGMGVGSLNLNCSEKESSCQIWPQRRLATVTSNPLLSKGTALALAKTLLFVILCLCSALLTIISSPLASLLCYAGWKNAHMF